LVVIDTINRRIPPFADTITLGPPDSAYMAVLEAQTNRWGFVTKPTGPARTNSRMGPMEWRTDGKTMLTGSCAPLRCNDEASTLFVFRYVSDEAIRGEWFHALTGIGVLRDPGTGRQIHRQVGVFCMRRI
jgi:hypothetical protein